MRTYDDLRATPRFKLFQLAGMTVSGERKRVHVLNLSAGGALLYSPEPPVPGTPMRLECGDAARFARVAWARGRRFGVTFALPLANAQVDQVIADQQELVSAASLRIGVLADAA